MAYVLVTSLNGKESERKPLPVDNNRQAENLARLAANHYIIADGYSGRFHFTARTWTLTKDETEVTLQVVETD